STGASRRPSSWPRSGLSSWGCCSGRSMPRPATRAPRFCTEGEETPTLASPASGGGKIRGESGNLPRNALVYRAPHGTTPRPAPPTRLATPSHPRGASSPAIEPAGGTALAPPHPGAHHRRPADRGRGNRNSPLHLRGRVAQPRPPERAEPAADDPHLRPRRRHLARRALPAAPHGRPPQRDVLGPATRHHLDRGQGLLQPRCR